MPEELSKMARCPKCNKIKTPDFEDKEKYWYSCSDCDQYWIVPKMGYTIGRVSGFKLQKM